MTISDWFNSTTCPWWINALTLIAAVAMIRDKWKRTPMIKDDAFMFGWMVIVAFVNLGKLLEKLAHA